MDRDQFETGLDRVIAAHGRKVRAGIDAAACGTRSDWNESHRADDAYAEAREAFSAEVFAPRPAGAPAVVSVLGREERERGRSRGRPMIWRRGVEVTIAARGVTYTFGADADSLVLDAAAVESGNDGEIRAADFNPLRAGHSIRFRGLDYSSADAGPEELVKLAVEACRAVALRLHAHGIGYGAVTRDWPKGIPAFADVVQGEVSITRAA